MYTLESLKPLNAAYDSEHRLEQSDVEMANHRIQLIENSRGEKPCIGDIIEYTDEYGIYSHSAHIQSWDNETRQLSICTIPTVPFVFLNEGNKEVRFSTDGGPWASVDTAALTYVGKREKLFKEFGHCGAAPNGSVCFKAQVNVWEYIAPNQKHPGYSTKDWAKEYINYAENPADGSGYHYCGKNIVFKTAAELQRWRDTYKAVEFAGHSPNQTVFFFYREASMLVSREEWDALDLPLDTRQQNGIIHVKVDYDDDTHLIAAYRFTNSGYLDHKKFGPYERAKGTALAAPGPEII
ncbi:MAG: DUF4121 family protein [Clostridia bacterium]|nr:DUF4121 family protein [Clostridia bacterium]